LLNEETTCFPY